MVLSVLDRLLLLNAPLPGQGDITTLKIVRQLRETLSFTEEEHETWHIRQVGDEVKWDVTVPQDVDLPLTPKQIAIMTKALDQLSEMEKLTEAHFSVWEKCHPEEPTT